jgi:Taurine catabolism dioxygenase TauD, TfdA family
MVRYNRAMTSRLEDLAAQALKTGWASGSGPLELLRFSARNLGWSEVAFRSTDPPVTSLRPLGKDEARPNSLSSRYGRAAQPLHTDGAHLAEPPDFVLLLAEKTSEVPTLLWKCEIIHYQLPSYTDLMHGVFLVRNGSESFFRTAASGLNLRYDPGCMTPCDERSRRAVGFFASVAKSVVEHRWDAPGKVLLIDNRRVLHARATAEDEPDRDIKRVAFRTAASDS